MWLAADKVFWKKICAVSECNIFTIDYSENINLKPKQEAQSAHFSGCQHTLHCCVHQGGGKINYIYHLSDDTNHDNVMTATVIEDLTINHSGGAVDENVIVLRSDNYPTQFKSRFVFAPIRKLAIKYKLKVVWFYGEPGHGKGLVDAMSSFGCKSPLRQMVINHDKWYDTAAEMKMALEEDFKNGSGNTYRVVEADKLKIERRRRKESKIPGCKKMHLICVDVNGLFTTKNVLHVNDKSLFTFNFEDEDLLVDDCESDDDSGEGEINDDSALDKNVVYDIIEPETYIGLRCPPESMELLYVVEVLEKGVDIKAPSSCILKGEKYVKVRYLEKTHESTRSVKFNISKYFPPAFVNLGEIFTTNIGLDNNLNMHINEYRSLCSQIY